MEEPGGNGKAWGKKLKTSFLSGSYFLMKKMKGIGSPLMPEVESLHTPTDDYHWNESYYFNFADFKRGIGGWTRIGMQPNQETDMGAIMFYAGGSRILASLQGGRIAFDEDGISLGELRYQRVEALKKWRVVFDGEMMDVDNARKLPDLKPENLHFQKVEVDLECEGIAPCFDFKNANPRALAEMIVEAGTRLKDLRKVSRVSSEHYEQVMRINGTVKIGNREINFQGTGHRDHSWGPRDWAAPRLWTWLTCQFGEELCFNLSRVSIASVDIYSGFVTREGRNFPLRRAALETEFEEDGIAQRALWFRLEDTGGEIMDVTGDVQTVIPLRLESGGNLTLVNEALTEYRFGDRVGYGIAEYLHQLGPAT